MATRTTGGATPAATRRVVADPVVADLVAGARNGEQRAWDALVERFAPLIWSVCRQYRLGDADAEDVGQTVWLRLVDQLDRVRDPAALPGWLATTTRRECARVRRGADRHARRGSAGALRRDQRQAGHRGRQHRAHPGPLPGPAPPPPRHRRPDRRGRQHASNRVLTGRETTLPAAAGAGVSVHKAVDGLCKSTPILCAARANAGDTETRSSLLQGC
jgi:RNA polymerase sigma factor (sigma-70 family)